MKKLLLVDEFYILEWDRNWQVQTEEFYFFRIAQISKTQVEFENPTQ